jgi:hypothetical protein
MLSQWERDAASLTRNDRQDQIILVLGDFRGDIWLMELGVDAPNVAE